MRGICMSFPWSDAGIKSNVNKTDFKTKGATTWCLMPLEWCPLNSIYIFFKKKYIYYMYQMTRGYVFHPAWIWVISRNHLFGMLALCRKGRCSHGLKMKYHQRVSSWRYRLMNSKLFSKETLTWQWSAFSVAGQLLEQCGLFGRWGLAKCNVRPCCAWGLRRCCDWSAVFSRRKHIHIYIYIFYCPDMIGR